MVAFITLVGKVTRAEPFSDALPIPGFEFALAVEDASRRRDGSRRQVVRTIYRISCFAEVACIAARVARPGSLIAVTGRLCPYDWKDRNYRYRIAMEVLAADIVAVDQEAPRD